jgi:agmatine deiminase
MDQDTQRVHVASERASAKPAEPEVTRADTAPGRPEATTPRADGLRLPARFVEHGRTLVSWPCRADVFGPLMGQAREEWAEVVTTIAGFEPVTVIARPGDIDDVRSLCGAAVDVLALPLDDSWIRDNGPIFVRDGEGRVAVVGFGFDGWNGQFTPYDNDALVPERVAEVLGARFYRAPFVLEGGAFNTDGEGTLLTTEQCLLHSRNLGMSRREYEAALRDWLGIERVVWLPFGLVEDSGPLSTAGHVDDVAQFVAPGVVLAQTAPPGNPNRGRLRENLEVLREACDAAGRRLQVVAMELLPYVTGVGSGLALRAPGAGKLMPAPYVNLVFVNGGVLLPRLDVVGEKETYDRLREMLPGREVVGLPVEMSAFGGGGLGCITQQVPAGDLVPQEEGGVS